MLVAEDDGVLRGLIATALRADGFQVTEASDGVELLDAIERLLDDRGRRKPTVVVSDVHMPRLDGLDVLTILRCADVRVRVVLITAFGDEETAAEARELGSTVLVKPFEISALEAAIRTALAA